MKKFIILFTLLILPFSLNAADMRKVSIEARKEFKDAITKETKLRDEIRNNRELLLKEISKLKKNVRALKKESENNNSKIAEFSKKNKVLEFNASKDKTELDELSGAVRTAAGNISSILKASTSTVKDSDYKKKISYILDTKRFPGIDDMETIASLYFKEIGFTGSIELSNMDFISDKGTDVKGKVLNLGGFTSAYKSNDKTGLLNYSPGADRFFALTANPPGKIKANLNDYIEGKTDSVYIDISRGSALRQISHQLTLKDQIKKGGFLVWPILGLGLISFFIGIERFLFLGRVHSNADKVMGKVNELASEGRWDECTEIVGKKKIPVYNVLRAGLSSREEKRETLESILQESILKELPKLERFLPLLNIMGAISPLLGLLGTVTGMISTFHIITLYGTGDPRMMSGGISTALVTTMLGLAVAIPVMLLYTFLSRRVDHIVGEMEEKAVALTNIVFRREVKE